MTMQTKIHEYIKSAALHKGAAATDAEYYAAIGCKEYDPRYTKSILGIVDQYAARALEATQSKIKQAYAPPKLSGRAKAIRSAYGSILDYITENPLVTKRNIRGALSIHQDIVDEVITMLLRDEKIKSIDNGYTKYLIK
jgi:predicted HTH transcriptional regulator